MHPNPTFRGTPEARSIAFAQERGFGVLAASAQAVPILAHVPFLLNDGAADLHLVRSNPLCALADGGTRATLIVSGPDGYISPDWYAVPDQVPTWNYVAVHLIGRLEPLALNALEPMLARQSAHFEGQLDKPAWTMDKMSAETKARFLRMIRPFRLQVDEVQSTWKLGQNKPDDVRRNAADKVEAGMGAGLPKLAGLMRDPS